MLKIAYAVVGSIALAAIAWGAIAGSQPVAQRLAVRAAPVDAAWYAMLPGEPNAATRAFVERVPADAKARAEAFTNRGYAALMLRLAVLIVASALVMFTGLAARMRDAALRLTHRAWLQDALFAIQFLSILLASSLPVEVFAGFVRYREAGLSHAGFWQWLSDYALQWAVDLIFYAVGIVAIMALIRRRPQSWPAWATLVYVALYATYSLVSPLYIAPLFNQYTQLPDGPARERILSLARANGVPADGVYVRDASRQSVILNASVSGLMGTARITLDDNTVLTTPPAELELVMAHEIGHYVLRHVFKETVLHGLVIGVGFLLIAGSMRRLLARYGKRWRVTGAGDVAALPVFWLLFALWGFIALPADNTIQREDEAEADLYGLNASRQPLGLAEFMLRDADVRPLEQGAFVEWALYSHPTPAHRIASAMRWRAENLPH